MRSSKSSKAAPAEALAQTNRPEDAEGVRAATAALQRARAQCAAAQVQVARARGELLDAEGGEDAGAIMRARQAVVEGEIVESCAARVVERCTAQRAEALDAARLEAGRALRTRHQAALAALAEQLERAMEANRAVAAVEAQAISALGYTLAARLGLCGATFAPFRDDSGGTGSTKLDTWREFVAREIQQAS